MLVLSSSSCFVAVNASKPSILEEKYEFVQAKDILLVDPVPPSKWVRLKARAVDWGILGVGYSLMFYVCGIPKVITLGVLGLVEMLRDVFGRSPGKIYYNLRVRGKLMLVVSSI